MPDYINREAAVKSVYGHNAETVARLQTLPAADVVEVVRGEWGNHIFDGIMGGRPRTYMCSFCNYTFPVKTNYCPNCGAKMSDIPTGSNGGADNG